MHVLCVAEKPSIAKSVSQILSGGQYTSRNTNTNYIKNYEFNYPQTNSFYVVTSVAGHLTASDFPDSHKKWHSCDAFSLFDAPVETLVPANNKHIEQNLKTQARRADILMIWTDCDREGEHIGLEIYRVCRSVKPGITLKRARFSAIIPQQIHNAAQHPVELDRAQAAAVEARIILDLKIGAAFTRMQTMNLQTRINQLKDEKSVISYGSCQFPTLGFVVARYNRVKDFVPEPFWYIYLALSRPSSSQGNIETEFKWRQGHLFDQLAATNIYEIVLQDPTARVTKVTNKATKKWKPLPLTTVELQKAGSRLLRLAPKKVLDIAEKLYQQGFVSYPRTETDQYDPQFDFLTLIRKQTVDPAWGEFATNLEQGGFNAPRKGKNNDHAHPPIHPTAHVANLNGDEKRVYEFITRRFLACCSKDAEGWQTTVDVVCGGEEFFATGLVVLEKNYLLVYPYDKWVGHVVPEFEEGEEFQPSVCELKEGVTSKPNYLTEADLVTLMDKNGIGTDATIAQHIETIIERSYVIERMEGATKYLIPSTLGIGLIEGYNQIGLDKSVSKPQLRRETERSMVQVCQGAKTKNEMLNQSIDQYKEMFIIARREFDKVVSSVRRYLDGNVDPPAGAGAAGGGGGGGSGGGGGGGGGPKRGAGGRGAWCGVAAGRGNAPASRGRRANMARAQTPMVIDTDDDFDEPPPPPPPAAASRARQTGPASASRQTGPASTSRQTGPAPISRQPGASSSISAAKPLSMRKSAPPFSVSSAEEIKCNCNIPAIQLTVTKESASKGKQFYKCMNQGSGGCEFFKWADDVPIASGSGTGNIVPAKRTYSARQDSDSGPTRMCNCPEPDEGVVLTVTKEGDNKGRTFWACRKGKDGGCSFFEWTDEPPRAGNDRRGGMSQIAGISSSGRDSRMNTDECYKCHQVGHWANACPNDGSDANKRSRSFGTTSNAAPAGICFKCQQPGHYSSKCPNGEGSSKSKRTTSNNGVAAGECFNCGGSGHWSKDCPQNGGPGRVSSSSSTHSVRGSTRGRSTKTKRGGRGGSRKKSAFGAADGR